MRTMLSVLFLGGVVWADPTIDSIRLGKLVLGPDVNAEDMKGKVVLVEEWGIN